MTTNSRTGVQEPREECLDVPWKDIQKMIQLETSLHVNVSDAGGGRRLFQGTQSTDCLLMHPYGAPVRTLLVSK